SRLIILQCCLPSGHLAPHHSRGDLGMTVAPGKAKTDCRTKWVMGRGEGMVAWLPQSA
ncbi:unnamed protein product, partial [Tetraodon nigroviridis]